MHLGSFVSQDFVPGLRGDFKVLRYGTRFYAIARKNRPDDFRASGSGVLDFRPEEWHDMTPVLDSAWAWSECMASPFVSMDIGHAPETSGATPVLIEFQCVSFGPSAIENSQDISSDLPEAGTLSRLSPTWWMSLPRPQSSISQSLVVPDTMHLLIVSAFDFNGGGPVVARHLALAKGVVGLGGRTTVALLQTQPTETPEPRPGITFVGLAAQGTGDPRASVGG